MQDERAISHKPGTSGAAWNACPVVDRLIEDVVVVDVGRHQVGMQFLPDRLARIGSNLIPPLEVHLTRCGSASSLAPVAKAPQAVHSAGE